MIGLLFCMLFILLPFFKISVLSSRWLYYFYLEKSLRILTVSRSRLNLALCASRQFLKEKNLIRDFRFLLHHFPFIAFVLWYWNCIILLIDRADLTCLYIFTEKKYLRQNAKFGLFTRMLIYLVTWMPMLFPKLIMSLNQSIDKIIYYLQN